MKFDQNKRNENINLENDDLKAKFTESSDSTIYLNKKLENNKRYNIKLLVDFEVDHRWFIGVRNKNDQLGSGYYGNNSYSFYSEKWHA